MNNLQKMIDDLKRVETSLGEYSIYARLAKHYSQYFSSETFHEIAGSEGLSWAFVNSVYNSLRDIENGCYEEDEVLPLKPSDFIPCSQLQA